MLEKGGCNCLLLLPCGTQYFSLTGCNLELEIVTVKK